jgi:protein-L-isoaspartate(D-aspartate) O-methyltransferase
VTVAENEEAERLIAELRAEGIRDPRVLEAMAQTPREYFVDQPYANASYDNRALPIDCGQTISQPYVVAKMTEALDVGPSMRVLEIGTGSGYQAAMLARLAARVYTVERHRELLKKAKMRFAALELTNIVARHGDGFLGWPEEAPFDRIIVTAAFRNLPESLTKQLTQGGILISPVGYESISQHLLKMIRTAKGFESEDLLSVVFVPMVQGLPQEGCNSDEDQNQS